MMRLLDKTFTLCHPFSRQICTPSAANSRSIIGAHLRNNCLIEARKLFDQNPTSYDTTTWNMMIKAYIESGQIWCAHDLFDRMPHKDVVSWNTMLSGFNKTKNPGEVYRCFLQMQRCGSGLSEYTVSTVISAVLDSVFKVLVPQIHALAVCWGLNIGVFVGSALMKGYASIEDQAGLGRVFDDILVKDITSWNALVSGYMDLGCMNEAQKVFDAMPEKEIVSWTILVNGYITNKRINRARSVFNQMNEKNVVSWTAMINGYVQNEKFLAALKLFRSMMESAIRPNQFTYSSILDACAGCSSLIMGQQVHANLVKLCIPDDIVLSTSLVDMYVKCGEIDAASCIFESMPRKNLESWNSILGGYARHGLGTRALDEFEKMIDRGFRPDQVTFINLLSACSHAGLVEEGERDFYSMGPKYGLRAGQEHYACMVDLYGRAGMLEKAETLIKSMPFKPDVVVWGALLGACGSHSDLELAEVAAEGMLKLKNDHPAAYCILSRIHGEMGVWSRVSDLRKMIKKKLIKKQNAGSWIEARSSLR